MDSRSLVEQLEAAERTFLSMEALYYRSEPIAHIVAYHEWRKRENEKAR